MDIVGVTWSGTTKNYQDFVSRHELTFPSIDDSKADIFGQLGIYGQPAWAMITPEGSTEITMGVLSENELAQKISELLAQS